MTYKMPQISKPVPYFSAQAAFQQSIKDVNLGQFKGKYLIMLFYPLDFSFVCPTEIVAFSDRIMEFRQINCEVIACSCDSHFTHLAWINTPRKSGGLGVIDIPIIADKSLKISRDFGVLDEENGFSARALFIIDVNSNLRQIMVNDNAIGRSVDEALRIVQALQYHEKNGDLCPINWKPGSKSISNDPDKAKVFFNEATK